MVTETKPKNDIIYVRLEDLLPNPYQPESRIEVDKETAKTFGLSILEHGLMQTPVARLTPDVTQGQRYEMGDGWLRSSGFQWLVANGHPEYAEMPIAVREFTDQQMADLVMEANTIRKDLNPIELANLYKKYLEDFGITQAELAKKHNCSQGEIANTIRLLELPENVREKIISHEISETHGRQLLRLNKYPDRQKKILEKTIKDGLTVNTLSNEVQNDLFQTSKSLDPNEGSWNNPPKFDVTGCQDCANAEKLGSPYGGAKKLRCLNTECWEKKQEDAIAIEKVRKEAESSEQRDALRAQGIDKFYDAGELKYNEYSHLRGLESPECSSCPKRGAIENGYDNDLSIVCLDPKCYEAKESEKRKEAEKKRKDEQKALLEQVVRVVDNTEDEHLLMVSVCEMFFENEIDEYAEYLGIEIKDELEEDAEIVAKIREKLSVQTMPQVLKGALKHLLQSSLSGWCRDGYALNVLEHLEGKDTPAPAAEVVEEESPQEPEEPAPEDTRTEDVLADLVIRTASNGTSEHIFKLRDIEVRSKTLRECAIGLAGKLGWGQAVEDIQEHLKELPGSPNKELLIGFLEGKG